MFHVKHGRDQISRPSFLTIPRANPSHSTFDEETALPNNAALSWLIFVRFRITSAPSALPSAYISRGHRLLSKPTPQSYTTPLEALPLVINDCHKHLRRSPARSSMFHVKHLIVDRHSSAPSSAGFHPPAAPPPHILPLTSSPSHPTSSVQRPMFHVKHRSLLKLTPQPHPSRSRYFVLTLALRAFDMPLPGSPMFHVKPLIVGRHSSAPSSPGFHSTPSHPTPSVQCFT